MSAHYYFLRNGFFTVIKKLLNPICGLQNLQKLANCSLTRNKNIMHNWVKSFLRENRYLIFYSVVISRDISIIFICHKKQMFHEYFVKKYRNRNTLSEIIPPQYIMQKLRNKISSYWQLARNTDNGDLAKILRPENIEE